MHIWDIPVDRLVYIRLSAWLIEAFFLLGNACTKTSILLAYRRLSARSHSTWFIRLTWAAITFTLVYTVALGLELVFVCRPFVSYWMSYSPEYKRKYKCGNEQIPIVFSAAASVLSDMYASVLPMLLIRTIRLSSRQRFGLYLLFSAGLFTAGIGTARLVFLVKVTTNYRLGPHTHDITWYGWPMFVSAAICVLYTYILTLRQALTDVEAHLAIICASLPALKALFQRYKISRVPDICASLKAHFARCKPSTRLSPSRSGPNSRTNPVVRRSAFSRTSSVSRDSFLDRSPTPESGVQRNDCQCALCASIDALEKGVLNLAVC